MAKKDEESNVKKDLTVREKMVIIILLLIVKVIKPFEWESEINKDIEQLNKFLNIKD